MLMSVSEKAAFSVEGINEALSSLSDADMVRLSRIARRYCKGRIDPDDLLQQAFVATLDGSRKCPRNIGVLAFLAGTMRSIASCRFKSFTRTPELHLIFHPDGVCEETSLEVEIPVEAPPPDQQLISEQEAGAIRTAILSLFADDELASLIVEGDMEGMVANEIRQLTGLDEKGYNSKRRLIRRRIDRAYPEGWKL